MGRSPKFNDKEKWCNHCKKWLPLDSFAANATTASGRAYYCEDCTGTYGKKYYADHKESIKTQTAAYQKSLPTPQRVKRNQSHAQWRSSIKAQAFALLGGKCSWEGGCDWVDPRALQIDHKHGGGGREIKQLGGTYAIYLKIIALGSEAQKDYQILCANHNWVKRHENKEQGAHA